MVLLAVHKPSEGVPPPDPPTVTQLDPLQAFSTAGEAEPVCLALNVATMALMSMALPFVHWCETEPVALRFL